LLCCYASIDAIGGSQVHGDYNKEDVGVKVDRPAEGDEAMATEEVVAAAE
jgi:small subunit ribosomal protein S3Ae